MSSASPDPRELFEQKKRNAALLSSLASIHAMCQQSKERQHTTRHLHGRLHQVVLKLSTGPAHAQLLGPRYLGRVTGILDELRLALRRHLKLRGNIVLRVLHHRLLSLQLCAIHHQLTRFLQEIGAVDGFPVAWRDDFERGLRHDENVLHATLVTVVTSSSFLQKEYGASSTRRQMEVLWAVRFELSRRLELSPVLADCLKIIYRKLVRVFGWELNESARRVPPWFLPLTAIEYSRARDQLTRRRPTYRGEIALQERGGYKRHVVVLRYLVDDEEHHRQQQQQLQVPSELPSAQTYSSTDSATASGASTTSGSHGQSHRHRHRSSVDVARRALASFMDRYGDVGHAHLLRLRGANFAARSPYIVRDFAVYGTVAQYLPRVLPRVVTTPSTRGEDRRHQHERGVARFLVEACDGLLFLHEHMQQAHHGLRGSNLLVNHHGRVVLADAGLRVLRAQLQHPSQYAEGDADYIRWLAPELQQPKQKKYHQQHEEGEEEGEDDDDAEVTRRRLRQAIAGDVFALGMCLIELLSGELPWAPLTPAEVAERKQQGDVLPARPATVSMSMWRLVERMCMYEPRSRLSLRDVRSRLEQAALQPDAEPEREEEVPQDEQQVATRSAPSSDVDSLASYKTTLDTMESLALTEEEEAAWRYHGDDKDQVEEEVEEANEEEEEEEKEEEEEENAQDVRSLTVRVDVNDRASDELLDGDAHVEPTTYELESMPRLLGEEEEEATPGAAASLPLAVETNNQITHALHYVANAGANGLLEPTLLLEELHVIRAFARGAAGTIHERDGIYVLQTLLSKRTDYAVQRVVMEVYQALLASGQVAIAESMVEQGVVKTIFATLQASEAKRQDVDPCVSLLLDLLALTDVAKHAVGDNLRQHVDLLEGNELVHHRSLQEIKSVLARFKQTEGNDLLKEGFHMLAVKKFTEAIQLDRKRGIYYADRSLAYCHGARYSEAAEDAERCVRYTPFDVQGYLRYGIAMKHLRKYEDALSALRKGRQVNPGFAQIGVLMKEVEQLRDRQAARPSKAF